MPRSIVIRDLRIEKKGQVGIVVRSGNKSICIDPGFDLEDCEIILCTHSHSRHCDLSTLSGFDGVIIAPFTDHTLITAENIIQIGDLRVVATSAYNRVDITVSNRKPRHPKNCCVGYILESTVGTTLYYTGDTDLVDELLKVEREIDILVPCIGRYTTLSPEEAFELIKSLRPRVTILRHFNDLYEAFKLRDLAYMYTSLVILR